jgi:hypothetical protein
MFVATELDKFIQFFNAGKNCKTAEELNPKVAHT